MIRRAPPAGSKVEPAAINFDLPLRNWNVEVILDDGTIEVLKVVARCPLSAVRLSSYTSEKWLVAKRLAVVGINVVKAS